MQKHKFVKIEKTDKKTPSLFAKRGEIFERKPWLFGKKRALLLKVGKVSGMIGLVLINKIVCVSGRGTILAETQTLRRYARRETRGS